MFFELFQQEIQILDGNKKMKDNDRNEKSIENETTFKENENAEAESILNELQAIEMGEKKDSNETKVQFQGEKNERIENGNGNSKNLKEYASEKHEEETEGTNNYWKSKKEITQSDENQNDVNRNKNTHDEGNESSDAMEENQDIGKETNEKEQKENFDHMGEKVFRNNNKTEERIDNESSETSKTARDNVRERQETSDILRKHDFNLFNLQNYIYVC